MSADASDRPAGQPSELDREEFCPAIFATLTNTNEFIKVEVRNQGGSGTTLLSGFAFSNSPTSFQVPVTAVGQVKEKVFREDSATSRARLNGFMLTGPTLPPELSLEVNTTNGAMRIVNEQVVSFDMNYYEIRSSAGLLDTGSWVGFDDTDALPDPFGSGWDEVPNSNSNLINEANLTSTITYTPGSATSLGRPFVIAGTPAFEFKYAGPNDTTLRHGIVKFIAEAAALAGDYNNNGVVDGADYILWRKGGLLQNEGRSTGITDQQDYSFWQAVFGDTGSSGSGSSAGGGLAIPEPKTATIFAVAIAIFSSHHRHRAPRAK